MRGCWLFGHDWLSNLADLRVRRCTRCGKYQRAVYGTVPVADPKRHKKWLTFVDPYPPTKGGHDGKE